MELLCKKRCIIGEGPIWNCERGLLYYVNGYENEVCTVDIESGSTEVIKLPDPQTGVAAVAFGKNGDIILSRADGVFALRQGKYVPLYDTKKHTINYCNDMKVGPDGRLYVGTLSEKKRGISERIDGKLYSIDPQGNVRLLLDGLIVSNGMDWSMDGTRFYHTDSDTHLIREYAFDKVTGDMAFTGREVYVLGVDGFTIDEKDRLFVACWGQGHIAVVDTGSMEITSYIAVPARIPASCAFVGRDMNRLVVVSATYGIPDDEWENDGMTFIQPLATKGRLPYLFDTESSSHLRRGSGDRVEIQP